jgi:hypothetical protein
MLNLPVNLTHYNSILFLGIGGGFDVYGSIPIFTHSSLKGKKVTFANLNSTIQPPNGLQTTVPGGDTPEGRLAEWLVNEGYSDCNVYTLPKCGVKKMKAYLELIKVENEIDFIMCVDGGVDSLMTGEEEGAGTIIEDTITMSAVTELEGVVTCLMCVGFGAEMEEGVCHYSALENISKITENGGFWGCCSLITGNPNYESYKKACEHGWDGVRKSHIHTKVISSVEGKFGDENLYDGIDAQVGGTKVINWINPLMSIMWFFDLDKVMMRNKLDVPFSITNTYTDVLMIYRQMIDQLATTRRSKKCLPI